MKKYLIIFYLAFPILGFGQSYVFYPEIATEEKSGFNNIDVYIVFKDSRIYEKKLKEKCTKEEIFGVFVDCIKRTYPNIKLTILDPSHYDDIPEKNNITIKVDFKRYEAALYTTVYISNTKYDVKIYDYRIAENIYEETITGMGNQLNVLGNMSGKIASNSSFKRAFDNFVLMLEKLPQPSNNQKNGFLDQSQQNINSKANRLRELKQLLDEKILTQEEFEKEKQKILEEK